MKKAVTLTLSTLFAVSALCGCNKAPSHSSNARTTEQPDTKSTQQTENINNDDINNVESKKNEKSQKRIRIILDGSELDDIMYNRRRAPISGVRRHLSPDKSGKYTVEYIHTPYGIDKDETLDYNLVLNNDNTFEFTVVSDGVTAEHSGRWYERRGQIILFYDEEIEQPQHNVYVADSLYAEVLPKGKIMFYDNCYTVVLSKQRDEYEIQPL
ncbi:MAG: hypothetical protein J1F69_02900 [Clostridiales bacterium]|nr:hypothetical protein [Clostridiales bacterium]